jgi:galactokinase
VVSAAPHDLEGSTRAEPMAFARRFGRAPEALARAPGRVNLLGEHTDYNDGYVLPTAIGLCTEVALALRDDDRVVVESETLGERSELVLGQQARTGGFIDYVAGVTRALAEHGWRITGFDALVRSSVPVGSGLSSSAALEVALLRALRARFSLPFDDATLAKLAHWGETHHVGVPVGLLDPMACSLADEHTALFLDVRTLAYERLAMPDAAEIAVVDSGVAHALASGDYRTRRDECQRAAALLGVVALRDATLDRLAGLPEPLLRRARHVITENERVLAGVQALRDGDAERFGLLWWASHASLRDDYEVSVPEVDAIVDRARQVPEILGARLTGGGFGGAVVVLARRGHAREAALAIAARPEHVLVPGDGGSATSGGPEDDANRP